MSKGMNRRNFIKASTALVAVSGVKEYFFLEKLYGKQNMTLRKIPRECFPTMDQITNYLGDQEDLAGRRSRSRNGSGSHD